MRGNTTWRSGLPLLVWLALVGMPPSVEARTDKGRYTSVGVIGCIDFLERFGDNHRERPNEETLTIGYAQPYGWINGYLTAYNRWAANGQSDIRTKLGKDDVQLWLVSYCLENPHMNTANALEALVLDLERR